ncbi:peptide-methionine (S)-S-oxide reductase MsrA [Cohnella panacarvi]|uniref:peptide-methionine (S)-S-oxide reductase MsrA n=1 Tax=Cohnella panacarvi TaxID=400776 RepID=UPI00047DA697|nr:peptide-methionine (S)-S-oxide reductase MsrA [Cohnella panacarvi]
MTIIRTLTLGMGCFWSPEALFGAIPGVIRTRVGYAGGTTARPTYREMGDHSEVVQLDFDEELLSYEQLLETFWTNHNPVNINGYKGRQYQSMLLYRDEDQQEVFHRVKQRMEEGKGILETEISPYTLLYLAEARHQKYYLRRFPNALAKLGELYSSEEELMNATLAARLNGLAKGYTNLGRIVDEIGRWWVSDSERAETIRLIREIRW